jgi:hypothetical protein
VRRKEAAPGECGLGSLQLGLPGGGELLGVRGRKDLSHWLRYRQGGLLGRFLGLGGTFRQAPKMRWLSLATHFIRIFSINVY